MLEIKIIYLTELLKAAIFLVVLAINVYNFTAFRPQAMILCHIVLPSDGFLKIFIDLKRNFLHFIKFLPFTYEIK